MAARTEAFFCACHSPSRPPALAAVRASHWPPPVTCSPAPRPLARRAARATPSAPDPSRRLMAVKLTAARPNGGRASADDPTCQARRSSRGTTRDDTSASSTAIRGRSGTGQASGGHGAGGGLASQHLLCSLCATRRRRRGV